MIRTLLIANRGEIACRIIRACRRLGIRAVAVYSDADAHALHVESADEAIHIGPAPASESYLVINKLIAAAWRSGADALHPGYGFLAENADLAQACADAGLIFVGPSPAAIAAMGDKRAARRLVRASGVPVAPGYDEPKADDTTLLAAAQQVGFPLMVKAAAGGGGKGMRRVERAEELAAALAGARREAEQAFGSAEMMLEKLIQPARHIEFQIFGDSHGQIIHLGERDCSVQRRHQKVIEETPAVDFSAELRARMGAAAVAAGQAIGYTNAGTVEFLLAPDGQFYFLEMNTRIQVEHPVTEMVTGLDLVEWQLRVAQGEPLPLHQAQRGHAIEARLYAENPANDYLPVTGPVVVWQAPHGEGVRVESGLRSGDEIAIHYDPLLAKIIAHGPDRPTALRRLRYALDQTVLLGFTHNQDFLRAILGHPAFAAGAVDTGFLAQHGEVLVGDSADLTLPLIAASLAQWKSATPPATTTGYWRNSPYGPARYRYSGPAGATWEVSLAPARHAPDQYEATLGGRTYQVTLADAALPRLTFSLDGRRQTVWAAGTPTAEGINWHLHTPTGNVTVHALPQLPRPQANPDSGGSLRAPMPGLVTAVLVTLGQQVAENEPLLKLEAMKMEHTIRSAAPGVVTAIHYQPGERVEADAQLIAIRPLAPGA